MSRKSKRNRRRKAQRRRQEQVKAQESAKALVSGCTKDKGQRTVEQPSEVESLSWLDVNRVVVPMMLVLGVLVLLCAHFGLQYLAANQKQKVNIGYEDEIQDTVSIADRVLFVSKHYEVSSLTEESIRYSGIDDAEGALGLLIVDDLGVYPSIEEGRERVMSAVTEGCVGIPITDTTSQIYKQQLGAYEVKTDWVCMSVYYYYDEDSKRLYSLTYSNEPEYYEESLARATKELLSVKFE